MKLITRNTDYAIRAVCHIAKSKENIVSAADLVKALRIPRPFLRKILQKLTKDGVLRSYKGLGGGFCLNAAPDKLRLVKIMEAFQGPVRINECFFKKDICPNRRSCGLKRRIDRIGQHVSSELKGITIKNLIN